VKKAKIPRPFRKVYSSKALERKILRRIHIPADRDMVKALFVEERPGKWQIPSNPGEEKSKKLISLARSIGKNHGLFQRWKVFVFFIPLASLLLFNFIFKDRLVESGVEKALESLFLARSDVEGLHLSLFKGELSFLSLSITDKDAPDFNLMETGPGLIELKMTELAFKRLRIEEISLQDVRWNTPRQSSGALAGSGGKGPKASEARGEKESSGGINLPELSPQEMVEQINPDSLKSYEFVKAGNEQFLSIKNKWTDRLNEKEQEVLSLKEDVESLISLQVSNLTDIQDIQNTIASIAALKTGIEGLSKSARTMADDFREDRDSIISVAASLPGFVEDDIDSLEERLSLGSGGIENLASDLAERFVGTRWNKYYDSGLKVWNLYKRFSINEKEKDREKPQGVQRSAGRNVLFPSPDRPLFYMDKVLFSGSLEDDSSFLAELRSVSNEPEKVSDPVSLDLVLKSGGFKFTGKGVLDLRKKGDEKFSLDFDGDGISVELAEGIPTLSIDHFSSVASIRGRLYSYETFRGLESSFVVQLNDLKTGRQQSGFVGDTVKSILANQSSIEFSGLLAIGPQGIDTIKINTDFDQILNNGVGAALARLREEARGQIEAALAEKIGPLLDENNRLSEGLDALGLKSLNQMSSLGEMETLLESKKEELLGAASLKQGEDLLKKAGGVLNLPGF